MCRKEENIKVGDIVIVYGHDTDDSYIGYNNSYYSIVIDNEEKKSKKERGEVFDGF